MGRVLTVRLSAVTYSEEDVYKTWPSLCALAWPGQGETRSGAWRPCAPAFVGPVAPEKRTRGVVDLAHDLLEESRFGDWEPGLKNLLEQHLADLAAARSVLDKALEDWQPREANRATDMIEDVLDKLEKSAAHYQA